MEDSKKIMRIVEHALDILYERESYLFENNSSERNLVFHFSRYLIDLLKGTEFEKLSVDCEYNRDALSEKGYKEIIYEHKYQRIFPDLIIHERGSNDRNVLAIEFKKHNNRNSVSIKNDFYKLEALTSKEADYKYSLGLFICFGKDREKVKIESFRNGAKVN